MQESIVFVVRVQCRRKESSRSLSHLLMSFLLQRTLTENVTSEVVENLIKQSIFKTIALETLGGSNADLDNFPNLMVFLSKDTSPVKIFVKIRSVFPVDVSQTMENSLSRNFD